MEGSGAAANGLPLYKDPAQKGKGEDARAPVRRTQISRAEGMGCENAVGAQHAGLPQRAVLTFLAALRPTAPITTSPPTT
jgi:hypothetical protein